MDAEIEDAERVAESYWDNLTPHGAQQLMVHPLELEANYALWTAESVDFEARFRKALGQLRFVKAQVDEATAAAATATAAANAEDVACATDDATAAAAAAAAAGPAGAADMQARLLDRLPSLRAEW